MDGDPDVAGEQDIIFDSILDTAGRASSVNIRGDYTVESDLASVTLCAGATDATDPTCAGGNPFDTTLISNTGEWLGNSGLK